MTKPILSVDFDGVIHSYVSGWQGPGRVSDPPVEGALIALVNYSQHFQVAVFSSRSSVPEGLTAMQEWLAKWYMDDLEMSRDEAVRFVIHTLLWPTSKLPAMLTIDDRAITFAGVWPDAAQLLAFRPWRPNG